MNNKANINASIVKTNLMKKLAFDTTTTQQLALENDLDAWKTMAKRQDAVDAKLKEMNDYRNAKAVKQVYPELSYKDILSTEESKPSAFSQLFTPDMLKQTGLTAGGALVGGLIGNALNGDSDSYLIPLLAALAGGATGYYFGKPKSNDNSLPV